MSREKILACLTIATALLVSGGCDIFQNPPRRALPPTATDIHEYNWDTHVRDYLYLLKAKIMPEEFETYRQKLKFVPISEDEKEEVNWEGWDSDRPWWDPSPDVQGTFHDPTTTGTQRAFLKYENGYVYYLEHAGFCSRSKPDYSNYRLEANRIVSD